MDKELFELCKEVYERTRWESHSIDTRYFTERDKRGEQIPLYTSDYLLEKLDALDAPVKLTNRDKWSAYMFPKEQYADTPLKALLKLTLALAEADLL